MKYIDSKKVLARFGLETRRPLGQRALEGFGWLGLGAGLGAAVVLAARSPTVRGYLAKAKDALPQAPWQHRDGVNPEQAQMPAAPSEPRARSAHA